MNIILGESVHLEYWNLQLVLKFMKSDVIATVLGSIATVCWCVQLIPQIHYNWRRKNCTGLPPLMMFLWVISGVPFGIYFCVNRATKILQVQPHLFMFFCFVSFYQTCYYPPAQYPKRKIAIIILLICAFVIGTEVGFVLWLRPLYDRGIEWPNLIVGIIAIVLLGCGFLPVYSEILKRHGRVVGINFLFLFIDSLGAWLSIVSVILGKMDILGIIIYAIVAAMELGIFLSELIWYCLSKRHSSKGDVEELEKPKEPEELEEPEEVNSAKGDVSNRLPSISCESGERSFCV